MAAGVLIDRKLKTLSDVLWIGVLEINVVRPGISVHERQILIAISIVVPIIGGLIGADDAEIVTGGIRSRTRDACVGEMLRAINSVDVNVSIAGGILAGVLAVEKGFAIGLPAVTTRVSLVFDIMVTGAPCLVIEAIDGRRSG